MGLVEVLEQHIAILQNYIKSLQDDKDYLRKELHELKSELKEKPKASRTVWLNYSKQAV